MKSSSRLTTILFTALAATTCLTSAACDEEAEPVEPARPPIEGHWRITRTLASTSGACWDVQPVVTFEIDMIAEVGAEPEIVDGSPSLHYFDGFGGDGASAAFVTHEYVFTGGNAAPEDTVGNLPILIGHDLHVVDGALTGEAAAGGDGPNIGCSYEFTITGTRVVDRE